MEIYAGFFKLLRLETSMTMMMFLDDPTIDQCHIPIVVMFGRNSLISSFFQLTG